MNLLILIYSLLFYPGHVDIDFLRPLVNSCHFAKIRVSGGHVSLREVLVFPHSIMNSICEDIIVCETFKYLNHF